MYIPQEFAVEDMEKCKAIILQNGFASLISSVGERIEVTHLPVMLHELQDGFELHGHFSRGNPQWKDVANKEVLLVFQGPHCYVSASWYDPPGIASTWNYSAVHVYGRVQLIEDEAETQALLQRLVSQYEGDTLKIDWNETLRNVAKGVVGFKLTPTEIQGKFKLSQNRKVADQRSVIEHLLNSERQDEQAVARLMQGHLKL